MSPGGGFRKFEAFGVERETFVSWFTEGLALMKAAWSDEPRITFAGRFRQVDDLPIQPKPVQVRTLRDEHGRQGGDPAGFTIGKRVYLAVDGDRGRAIRS